MTCIHGTNPVISELTSLEGSEYSNAQFSIFCLFFLEHILLSDFNALSPSFGSSFDKHFSDSFMNYLQLVPQVRANLLFSKDYENLVIEFRRSQILLITVTL